MATTVTSIRTALETMIAGLTPAGDAFGNSAYQVTNSAREWDSRDLADIDREFSIGDLEPGQAPYIGRTTDTLIDTTVSIIMGHTRVGESDFHKSIGRRDRDLEQIARAMEDSANYPSDVCRIEIGGTVYEESETYWISEMSFEITYIGGV